ncbi:phage tail protein [Streptomyces goshikiensis]|uniref:phage tail protein n=1 Tax=Streptomyces goshikiensis TaxID=1942 RepID=UPI00365487AA
MTRGRPGLGPGSLEQVRFVFVVAGACHDVRDHRADGSFCGAGVEDGRMLDDAVVTHQCQVELGGLRVETLKSVSAVTVDQEYIDVVSMAPSGKIQWDYVQGLPGWKNVTLTRSADKSEVFTKWIQEARDPAATGEERDLVLVFVNARNEPVKKMSFARVHPVSWSGPGVTAGESGVGEETLELRYLDVDTKFL